MNHTRKPLVRLALAIHRQLATSGTPRRVVELPTSRWRRSEQLAHKIRRAEIHNWQLAATELCYQLRHSLPVLQSQLLELETSLSRMEPGAFVASPSDIYHDLVAVEEQFDGLSFDHKTHWLSVATEPITLEGRFLGAFEIRLDWTRLRSESAYRVIALDSHPAAARPGVTHPHVVDETLCEGDGRQAIRQALDQGRLLDFFVLVANLLRTYNAESPFVALADWDGEACSDCGDLVTAEERFDCEQCEAAVCYDCQTTCGGCEASFCAGCITECMSCHDAYCRRCLTPCGGCRQSVCSGCLDDQERCPTCHEDELPESTCSTAEASGPAVHADRLAQTSVPA